MANVLEHECYSVLRDNLRSAISHCVDLANLPAQGPTYVKLREELGTIETCCRQVGAFRGDTRWNRVGWEMAQFHQRLGDCLRLHVARTAFLGMAEMMRAILDQLEKLFTAATGRRSGAILPKARPGPHRETRPVQVPKHFIMSST